MMLVTDWLDQSLDMKVLDESSGDGSANLELLDKSSSGDAEDLWDFLEHSFVLLLVEEDSVVSLLLYLGLGP